MKQTIANPATNGNPSPGAALSFCLRLARSQAVLTRRLDNALSSIHGLSFGDFMILYHLQRAPESRLRRIDLAERMGLTASGVTRSLLPLEKLGLVGRQSDARDARVGYAVVTKAGQKLLAHATVTVDNMTAEITGGFEPEQIQTLSDSLARLAGISPSSE